jgi:hypothetical protein
MLKTAGASVADGSGTCSVRQPNVGERLCGPGWAGEANGLEFDTAKIK